jgi:capsular polysaccharide biosynthesis protein
VAGPTPRNRATETARTARIRPGPPPPGDFTPTAGITNGHGPSQEYEPGQDWSRALWEALKHRPGRSLLLSLAIAVFAAALGATLILREPGKYNSTATLLINDPQQLATAGDDGMINKLNALRLKYAGLVSTSTIAGPVAQQLGIDERTVATSTVALPGPDSLILSTQATTSNPSLAERMAQGVADELIAYVDSENSRFQLASNLQYTFSVVNPATSAVQIAPSHGRAATVAGAMAAVAVIAAYVTLQLVAPRRSRE